MFSDQGGAALCLRQGPIDPAPTFPNSLLQSVHFAQRLLGLAVVDNAPASGRIRGAAASHCPKNHHCRGIGYQRPPTRWVPGMHGRADENSGRLGEVQEGLAGGRAGRFRGQSLAA